MSRSLILLLAVALAVSACQNTQFNKKSSASAMGEGVAAPESAGYDAPAAPTIEPGGLPLSPEQRFLDVPLPQGAKHDLEHSFIYESGNLQLGRMVYTSKSSIAELAQFYVREAVASGWKLVSSIEADGVDLFYEKPDKRLTISIRGGAISRGRQLTLVLTPATGL